MIDYPSIRPALKSLISDLSSVDERNVVWEDQGQLYGQTQIRLKIASPTSIGIDWATYEDNEEGELTAIINGQREFTRSMSVEAISQEDDEFAPSYLERVRTRIYRESSLIRLRKVNLSIANIQNVIEVPFNDGDHIWSKYILDIRFNTIAVEEDTTYDGGWIETVEINSTLNPGSRQTSIVVESGIFSSAFSSAFKKAS
jgi:hypothetical protein